jgi:hypothetical protein
LYIPNCDELKRLIMDELHKRPYTSHPGYQNMITDTRKQFYWPGLKKDIANYLAKCLECQQVKAEHRHPTGLLQPLPIPEWKWETISMDFIIELPNSTRKNDAIMVVVDMPFRLHGMPKEIVSDKDTEFTSNFWKSLMASFETKSLFNIAYHPQIDGQTERLNQIVEDMLSMHVMRQPKKWEDYLPLVEFAYNSGYQESLKMSPCEALYGRQCKIPISWNNLVDRITTRPDMLKEMEQQVIQIKENLKIAQDRQKSYATKKGLPESSRQETMSISELDPRIVP